MNLTFIDFNIRIIYIEATESGIAEAEAQDMFRNKNAKWV